MAIAESKKIIEHREIILKDRPQTLYDISSKGTVPVLYIDENNIIDESFDIMIWAISNSNCNWLAINKKEQLSIINNIDKDFKFWLDRYKYFDRHPQHSQNFYKNKCIKYLEQYNILLGDSLYLFDNSIQMVDVALFPFVRQFAHVNLEWFEITFKNFNLWLNRIKKSELFLSIMLKYDIWDQKGEGTFTDYLSNR